MSAPALHETIGNQQLNRRAGTLRLTGAQTLEAVGRHAVRYSLVLVLFWIGGMKFTAYEAEGISGFVSNRLFAAGWSACFMSAMSLAASQRKVPLPADRAVDADVDLGLTDGGYLLRARLNVSLPGLEREIAQAVVDAAHQICPYSKATRGNIDVAINLV
jgi:lipoyl-dependent peroxiredoxin